MIIFTSNVYSNTHLMKQNDNLLIAIAAVWLDRIIPIEELLQRKSDLVCSTYLLSDSNDDWIGNPIPYAEFAFKRWKYFQKKFQTSYGIPQFFINHQRTFTGGVGRTNENSEEWINKILEEIKLTKKQNLSVIGGKNLKRKPMILTIIQPILFLAACNGFQPFNQKTFPNSDTTYY